jgi:hypothetical protein
MNETEVTKLECLRAVPRTKFANGMTEVPVTNDELLADAQKLYAWVSGEKSEDPK